MYVFVFNLIFFFVLRLTRLGQFSKLLYKRLHFHFSDTVILKKSEYFQKKTTFSVDTKIITTCFKTMEFKTFQNFSDYDNPGVPFKVNNITRIPYKKKPIRDKQQLFWIKQSPVGTFSKNQSTQRAGSDFVGYHHTVPGRRK